MRYFTARRLTTGLLFCCMGALASTAQAAAPRPNIVLIMSDDMGFSDLGCYGGEIETPVLDGLAADGLRFTQFYNTGRCCPTRASLLTGLYPHQAGIGHMTSDQGLEAYRGDLNRHCLTIAEALKPAGYRTYMAGKWHVTRFDGPKGPTHNWPLQRGFDKFYGTIKGGGNFYDPTSLCRGNTFITPANDPAYKPDTYYYTDAISDHAASFVREHAREAGEQPFFMYVAYTAAHWPMHALPADIARFKGRYDGGYGPVRAARYERVKALGLVDPAWAMTPQAGDWEAVGEDRAWEARCMEVYAAMVYSMDRGIGRIVAALKETGRFENTLILFLQDNGGCAENMGRGRDVNDKWSKADAHVMAPDELQPSIWPPMTTRDGRPVLGGPTVMPGPADTYIGYGQAWANTSNTPFREYKHYVHEGGIATPLIAHWPTGIRRRGELEHQPGHLVDLMATCVDLARADYPAERDGAPIRPLEGRSLAPAFRGGVIERDAIYWEHEGNRAIRAGKWKLVAKGARGAWELYDMEKDRTELHDLAAEMPEKAAELAAKWEAWAARAGAVPWPWKPAYGRDPGPEQSARKAFDLKAGDALPREEAPWVEERPFTVTAKIARPGEGVIVAQGGSADGWALCVREGRPVFCLRNGGALTEVAGAAALPATGQVELTAVLRKNGQIVLKANGRPAGAGKADGLMPRMPIDGLEVGEDANGLVGSYPAENAYGGRIEAVRITLP